MKILYIDCGMGAAGDMLTAALYELLDDAHKLEFTEKMNSLGISGLEIKPEPASKCGITGTHMTVTFNGEEECEHHHEHEHEHHHHHHSSMHDIEHIIEHLPLESDVKTNAVNIYKIIAEAESLVHGKPVTDIHFHEVGTMDAIADVTSVCLILSMLKPDKIISSPIHVGSGTVHCAHGILPVPAPATANILKGVPIYGGKIEGELCTPTGAALIKYFADDFSDMPPMSISGIGYGMGTKDFPQANCVRVLIGESGPENDTVVELFCNVDDMTPENIGFASEKLFETGALEVFTTPIGMKKSRPGILLTVMCRENKRDEIISAIFKYTTTIGIRENISKRYVLSRSVETLDTEFGQVRVKKSEGYGVSRSKFEYEDLAEIARKTGMSIDEVREKLS